MSAAPPSSSRPPRAGSPSSSASDRTLRSALGNTRRFLPDLHRTWPDRRPWFSAAPSLEDDVSQTQRPEIGATIDAGGIKTNYIEAGQGPAVVLVHGSGPGVTGYANWRRDLATLAAQFGGISPGMGRFT